MGKQKEKIICIVYLSTEGDTYSVEKRERSQLRYISDYAKAHNLQIKKILHRDVLSKNEVNRHWDKIVSMIKAGTAEGILVANMAAVSSNIPDAFYKIGKVYEVGGVVITVDEGRLSMPVKKIKNGRLVLGNERD